MKLNCKIILSVFFITVLSLSVNAQQLRLASSIPVNETAEIYGINGNNIIIRDGSKLTFLDSRLKPGKEIIFDDGQVPVVSRNGRFYAVIEKGEPDSATGVVLNSATIYSNRHFAQWGALDIADGRYFLSPNGDYLIVISSGGDYFASRMYLYHKDLPPKEVPAVGFESITIAPDGRHFLLDLGHNGDKLFNSSGEIIAEFPHHPISDFDKNSEYMAHFLKNELSLVESGRETETIELKGLLLKDFQYDQARGYLTLLYPNSVILYDLKNKNNIWQFHPFHKNGQYESIDYSSTGNYIACGLDINLGGGVVDSLQHTTGYVYLYGIDGKRFAEFKLSYNKYNFGHPSVQFMPGDRYITARTADRLYFIELY
ncbi:MAG: hypothetical protein ABIJ45_12410 [Candidatus Zixiibacteriota bacterium]